MIYVLFTNALLIPLCVGTIAVAGGAIIMFRFRIAGAMSLTGEAYSIAGYIIMAFSLIAIIRMGNWCMNDTFRASGDAVTGTVLELAFMYAMVVPVVCLAGLKFKVPIYVLFPLIYCDEPVRFVIMGLHLRSGKWIRPVTPQGIAQLEDFRRRRKGK